LPVDIQKLLPLFQQNVVSQPERAVEISNVRSTDFVENFKRVVHFVRSLPKRYSLLLRRVRVGLP
jgi:hypothetical protein